MTGSDRPRFPQNRRNGAGGSKKTPPDSATADRIATLRTIGDRIKAQLDDPVTPPYSVAPLSNQLRLCEKEIDRLLKPATDELDGLPWTPEQAGFVDFMRNRAVCRYRRNPHWVRPDGPRNAWCGAESEIHERWFAAGFETPGRDEDMGSDEWVEACRVELARCLSRAGEPQPKE
jgi:hypothetical protein